MGKSGNPAKANAKPTPKAEHDPTEVVDFDAFWEDQKAQGKREGKRVKLMGEVVELPPSLPLQFEMEAKRLSRSKDEDDMRDLLAILFGEGCIERWAEKGMDIDMFQTLVAWAPLHIQGEEVSLAEVAAEIAEADPDADPT